MIEKIVIDYLGSNLTGISVYAERPDITPSQYVLVEKTGGGQENKINTATIAVQSYAQTMYEAAQLNETIKGIMESLPMLNAVSDCTLNSDYNFTNNETKEYRYQAVFNIVYY